MDLVSTSFSPTHPYPCLPGDHGISLSQQHYTSRQTKQELKLVISVFQFHPYSLHAFLSVLPRVHSVEKLMECTALVSSFFLPLSNLYTHAGGLLIVEPSIPGRTQGSTLRSTS